MLICGAIRVMDDDWAYIARLIMILAAAAVIFAAAWFSQYAIYDF